MGPQADATQQADELADLRAVDFVTTKDVGGGVDRAATCPGL